MLAALDKGKGQGGKAFALKLSSSCIGVQTRQVRMGYSLNSKRGRYRGNYIGFRVYCFWV